MVSDNKPTTAADSSSAPFNSCTLRRTSCCNVRSLASALMYFLERLEFAAWIAESQEESRVNFVRGCCLRHCGISMNIS